MLAWLVKINQCTVIAKIYVKYTMYNWKGKPSEASVITNKLQLKRNKARKKQFKSNCNLEWLTQTEA